MHNYQFYYIYRNIYIKKIFSTGSLVDQQTIIINKSHPDNVIVIVKREIKDLVSCNYKIL